MEMNFCRRCGTKVTSDDGHVYKCENGHTLFLNSAPAAGVFMLTPDNQVILGVRAFDPFKGKLDTIGGFVDDNENLEQALAREIEEETGLTSDDYTTPVYLSSGIVQYRYGNEDCPTISAFFYARHTSDKQPVPSDDISEIVTLPINEVDVEAFGGEDLINGFTVLKKLYDEGKL